MTAASDELALKRCTRCQRDLPLAAFARGVNFRDGLQYRCRECGAEVYRQRQRARGKKVRERIETPAGHKHCYTCGETKPHSEWAKASRTKDGLATACRTCMAERGRRSYFKRTHGLTEADLEELRRSQDDRCAICWERNPQHVDHDHATGRVRGLLCFPCNVALGQMRDRPAILRRGAAYLEGQAWQPTPSAPGVFRLPSSPPAAPPSPTSSPGTPRSSFPLDVRRLREASR